MADAKVRKQLEELHEEAKQSFAESVRPEFKATADEMLRQARANPSSGPQPFKKESFFDVEKPTETDALKERVRRVEQEVKRSSEKVVGAVDRLAREQRTAGERRVEVNLNPEQMESMVQSARNVFQSAPNTQATRPSAPPPPPRPSAQPQQQQPQQQAQQQQQQRQQQQQNPAARGPLNENDQSKAGRDVTRPGLERPE